MEREFENKVAHETLDGVFGYVLINKASVCEILSDVYPTDGEDVVSVKDINEAYEKIIHLPSTKLKLGHWIENPNAYECSECNIVRAKGMTGKYNFCPSCGAKMEVE